MEGVQGPLLQTHTKSVLEFSLDNKILALNSKIQFLGKIKKGTWHSEFFSLVPKI